MTDTTDTVLEKPAPGAEPAAADPKPEASPSPQGGGTDAAADPAQAPKADDPKPDALPEWIERAGRGDDKRIERLKRIGDDPAALLDSYLSLEAQMSKRGIALPGEKATAEELADFAKKVGIPEKPEDYKITPKLPEGFKFEETDQKIVSDITAKLHARGGILAHPQVIQAMQEVYAESNIEAQAQLVARATEIHEETQAIFDKEWGADKGRNFAFAKGLIDRFDTPEDGEEVSELLQLPLMNGAKLGDYPRFVRLMAKIGREFGDDPLFGEIGANGSDGIASLKQEKEAILKLRADGKFKEYDAQQGRLDQINDAIARQERKGR